MTIKVRTIIILKNITPLGSGKGDREAWRSRIAIQSEYGGLKRLAIT